MSYWVKLTAYCRGPNALRYEWLPGVQERGGMVRPSGGKILVDECLLWA